MQKLKSWTRKINEADKKNETETLQSLIECKENKEKRMKNLDLWGYPINNDETHKSMISPDTSLKKEETSSEDEDTITAIKLRQLMENAFEMKGIYDNSECFIEIWKKLYSWLKEGIDSAVMNQMIFKLETETNWLLEFFSKNKN